MLVKLPNTLDDTFLLVNRQTTMPCRLTKGTPGTNSGYETKSYSTICVWIFIFFPTLKGFEYRHKSHKIFSVASDNPMNAVAGETILYTSLPLWTYNNELCVVGVPIQGSQITDKINRTFLEGGLTVEDNVRVFLQSLPEWHSRFPSITFHNHILKF